MTIAWVVGAGGLLGSALRRELRSRGTTLFAPPKRFRWDSERELAAQIPAAVASFAASAATAAKWQVYWAAGMGTMSSAESVVGSETQSLACLLASLASERKLMDAPGALAFASSAGAIYAGSTDYVINEETSPAPTTPYGRAKLEQEDLLRSFSRDNRSTTVLLARLSTLYGMGQAAGKQQGLLTHIARHILHNRPVQIYVPFDTIRDYLTVGDAATAIVAQLAAAGDHGGVTTRIIASEQPATIAEIISIFKRIARRNPRIVTSASRMTNLYSRRVQFRSLGSTRFSASPRTSLLVGIAQLMLAERTAYVRNRDRGTC